ncbi:hypothetical protein Tsubulata_035655 [Turnera subulata]|uniref:Bifunctional inhibitor/plant lipid transfer protein/seed storage helical domain-containing protein n=1 Tax=Turnera subulata TaxID=218843 RepID=A0A9Q0EYY4_9ROSI|nr:hypothetical protein Tsubulata_035655 [Turnera subulata]
MASRGVNIGLTIAVLVAMLWGKAMSQSSCTNVLIGLASCLSYVSGSSSNPTPQCCSQLASVVKSQPQCLCMALDGGGASLGVSINETLALKLPETCKVQTPPASRCKEHNGPGMSPAGSPLPGGSKEETSGSSWVGENKNKPLQFIVFVLFMASCASATISF